MIKAFTLLLFMTVMTGCMNNLSVTKVGPIDYPPLTSYDSVLVFSSEAQIIGPFEVIGFIQFKTAGRDRKLEQSDAIEPIKEAARGIGANGVIIDESAPVSRGVSVEARAIRLGSK